MAVLLQLLVSVLGAKLIFDYVYQEHSDLCVSKGKTYLKRNSTNPVCNIQTAVCGKIQTTGYGTAI